MVANGNARHRDTGQSWQVLWLYKCFYSHGVPSWTSQCTECGGFGQTTGSWWFMPSLPNHKESVRALCALIYSVLQFHSYHQRAHFLGLGYHVTHSFLGCGDIHNQWFGVSSSCSSFSSWCPDGIGKIMKLSFMCTHLDWVCILFNLGFTVQTSKILHKIHSYEWV